MLRCRKVARPVARQREQKAVTVGALRDRIGSVMGALACPNPLE
jgi:hypothetical protein